jgi:hypothetical protein
MFAGTEGNKFIEVGRNGGIKFEHLEEISKSNPSKTRRNYFRLRTSNQMEVSKAHGSYIQSLKGRNAMYSG